MVTSLLKGFLEFIDVNSTIKPFCGGKHSHLIHKTRSIAKSGGNNLFIQKLSKSRVEILKLKGKLQLSWTLFSTNGNPLDKNLW